MAFHCRQGQVQIPLAQHNLQESMKLGLSLQSLLLPLPNPTLGGHQQLSATSQDLRQHCSSCPELKDTKPKIKTRKKFQEKSTITTKACAQDEQGGGTEKMPAKATPSLLVLAFLAWLVCRSLSKLHLQVYGKESN